LAAVGALALAVEDLHERKLIGHYDYGTRITDFAGSGFDAVFMD
jgi:hypothetical protein